MPRFTFECRNTGSGAFTTAGGTRWGGSRTGNHWMETVVVEIGQEIHLTDISNSGHHNCITYMVNAEGILEETGRGNDESCPVCAARQSSE